MSFTSVGYLIFLAAAAAAYYLVPKKLQNALLLAASLVFYMWAVPEYGVLVLATVGVCYFAGIYLEKHKEEKSGKAVYVGALLLVLGVLFLFKYYNFFLDVLGVAAESGRLSLVLPVGISFYTFTVIGYLTDIKIGKGEAEKNFINFALFVTFFPAILSGPIGRGREMLPQLKYHRSFNYDNVREGLQRFLTGAFRKVVLADGIGVIVGPIIADPAAYGGGAVIAAIILYNYMIYWDFAGYSDMAVGSAKMLGITIRENFAAPLLATDMGGFWKRWHMSLTSWLTDYIFTPLVWNRWANKLCFGKKWEEHKPITLINIVIVFLVSGVWHGAGMGYIFWGLTHGIIRVAEELVAKYRKKKKKKSSKKPLAVCLRIIKVNILATFTHMLFTQNAPALMRAAVQNLSPSVAVRQLLHLASNEIAAGGVYMLLYFGILAVGVVLGFWFDLSISRSIQAKSASMNPAAGLKTKARWALYWFMGLATAWFYVIAQTSGAVSFIYFGF